MTQKDNNINKMEMEQAEALRVALEAESEGSDDLLNLVGQIRATQGLAPRLSAQARDRAIEEALHRIEQKPRRPILRVLTPLVAVAAALVLIIGALYYRPSLGEAPTLPDEAYVASDTAFFDQPFPEDQSAADRVEVILAARRRGYFAALAGER